MKNEKATALQVLLQHESSSPFDLQHSAAGFLDTAGVIKNSAQDPRRRTASLQGMLG